MRRLTVPVLIVLAVAMQPRPAAASPPPEPGTEDRAAAAMVATFGLILALGTGSIASMVNVFTIAEGEASETGFWEWTGIGCGALMGGVMITGHALAGEVIPDDPGQLRAVAFAWGMSAGMIGLGWLALEQPDPDDDEDIAWQIAPAVMPSDENASVLPGLVLSGSF